MTNTQWFERAVRHLEIVQGLVEGTVSRDEFWRPMTVAEAIEIEKRNVVYCLAQVN
jgi:hypothetical protein